MLLRIHLPGLVGCGRPFGLSPGSSPRRRRGQGGPREPTLERALRRDGASRVVGEQLHADQGRTPGGVRAPQFHSGLDQGREWVGDGGVTVIWQDAVGAIATEPAEEAIGRGTREPQRGGDLRGVVPPLPEPEDHLTDR